MKKFVGLLSLALVFVLLGMATVCSAEVPGCAHNNKSYMYKEYGIAEQYPEAHWIPYWDVYECLDCGMVIKDAACSYIVQGHSFYKDVKNSYHDNNKGLHYHRYICSVCYYHYNIVLECDGPPCMDIQGIKPEYELQ